MPTGVRSEWSRLRGRFIVLDGGEGCGKSTQIALLADFLRDQGLSVRSLRDPGATPIGEQIRRVLLDPGNDAMAMRCEMLLYMAARSQMVAEVIAPALANGEVVVCDRFVSSTLAYQLGGDGLTADEILKVADVAISGCWPDLTIILDMPVERSHQRVKPKFVPLFNELMGGELPDASKDRIELRPMEYHRRVRQNFLDQTEAMPGRYATIIADDEVSAVHRLILDALRRLM